VSSTALMCIVWRREALEAVAGGDDGGDEDEDDDESAVARAATEETLRLEREAPSEPAAGMPSGPEVCERRRGAAAAAAVALANSRFI